MPLHVSHSLWLLNSISAFVTSTLVLDTPLEGLMISLFNALTVDNQLHGSAMVMGASNDSTSSYDLLQIIKAFVN